MINYFVWLNAAGVTGSLTFAGHLIAAGRSGGLAAPPFLLFALGLSAVGVRYISEYSMSMARLIDAVPGFRRHLRKRPLNIAATGTSVRLIDGVKPTQSIAVGAIVGSQLFFILGVIASTVVLLFA